MGSAASSLTAWVVDDDASIRWVLERALNKASIDVRCFAGGVELLDAVQVSKAPDVLLTDIRMPGISGLDLLDRVHTLRPALPVIIMTAHSDLDSAVSSYRGGAFEYLPKPFDLDEVVELIHRAARLGEQPSEDDSVRQTPSRSGLIGEAPAMQAVFRAIGRLAASHITVLITGESGTGKELVARALHEHGPRSAQPFIAINTAAIPRDLLESEFFGHEKGAFTGAASQRRGRFEQAHDGTLFLDEIGDMPADMQTRLLRVLQDGRFYRVGGHQAVDVDVRIIAATHQDLETAVKQGRFREDLYHRLNVIGLHVPPLRERREDIPLLLAFFLERASRELEADAKVLTDRVTAYLSGLTWDGNVRELENLCRRLTVMAPGHEVVMEDLPQDTQSGADAPNRLTSATTEPSVLLPAQSSADRSWDSQLQRWAEVRLEAGADHLLAEAMPRLERVMIRAALAHTGGHRQAAARLLGWGRNTLTRKIRELDIREWS